MSGGADGAGWAEQPKQTNKRTKKARRANVTRNRLNMRNRLHYLTGRQAASYGLRATSGAQARLRVSSSAGSNEFIDPDRKPSKSSVTNLNPSFLKMDVNSPAISDDRARGSSSRAISIRTISP